jgi:hypothetical protein
VFNRKLSMPSFNPFDLATTGSKINFFSYYGFLPQYRTVPSNLNVVRYDGRRVWLGHERNEIVLHPLHETFCHAIHGRR